MEILEICNLSKSFDGKKVVKDLSFSVKENSIFGFIGPNGAGKTTTMKMILGLLRPDKGEVFVCGEKVNYGQNETNRFIGYLPDVPEFYGYMKPAEYLKLCGDIAGMPKEIIKKRSEYLLDMVGLDRANRRIFGFSRGMKQRMGIAQALLNEPKLLICDEPTSALDPVGRKEVLDIIKRAKGKTTVLFSTHILSDVENICDELIMIKEGELVLQGPLSKIKSKYKREDIAVEFTSCEDKNIFLKSLKNFSNVESENTAVIMKTEDIKATHKMVLEIIKDMGLLPSKIEILEPTLESLFLEVVK